MTKRLARRGVLLSMAMVVGSALHADPTPQADPALQSDPVTQEFVLAMQRVRQRQPEPADPPELDSYVLHDYLLAARLRRDLADAARDSLDARIDGFLSSHAGQPVSRALRHEWLQSLARRGRWDWFLPRAADSTDPQIACDRLAGRLATGNTVGLKDEVLARWSLPQRQPLECGGVFTWLRAQGAVTAALAETRTRAALAADNPRLAREFVTDVPEPRAVPLLQWIQLLESPQRVLATLSSNPQATVDPEALAAGFNRLSFADYAGAAALLPGLLQRPDLTAQLRVRLQRSAALGAAYGRAPGAADAFDALPDDPSDTQVQEWRVRAALWARDFPLVRRWIEAMPPALANLPRWRYWRARAVAAVAGTAAAAPLYADLANLRDYYGYLAADHLNTDYQLNIHRSPDDMTMQAALAAEPGLRRAHALFDADMVDDAGAEWAAVISAAKPTVKVQAARLASRWGWYAQTIATLAQAGEWDDVPLRYPRPYATLVADASKQTHVPEDWILAIMRQESLFRKDAVSRADARGLMQMQPGTAAAVARRWHLSPPTRDRLFEPSVAISLGALFVRELLDKYDGRLDETLAAYNAGSGPVARWLPQQHPLDADIWIENIPYTETRAYVQHILEHIVAFAAMRDATPPRLTALLPSVQPPATPVP